LVGVKAGAPNIRNSFGVSAMILPKNKLIQDSLGYGVSGWRAKLPTGLAGKPL